MTINADTLKKIASKAWEATYDVGWSSSICFLFPLTVEDSVVLDAYVVEVNKSRERTRVAYNYYFRTRAIEFAVLPLDKEPIPGVTYIGDIVPCARSYAAAQEGLKALEEEATQKAMAQENILRLIR